MLSNAFLETKRGQKGRRALRHLDDNAIARAKDKDTPQHRLKFMSSARQQMAVLKTRLAMQKVMQ